MTASRAAGDLRLRDLLRPVRELVKPQRGEGPLVLLEHVVAGQLALSGWGDARELRTMGVRFREGDLLFGALRPGHRKVIRARFGGVCSAEFLVLRPIDPARAGLAFAALSSPATVARAARRAIGTRMPRVKWADLADLAFPRPEPAVATLIDALANTLEDRLVILEAAQARRAAVLVALSRGDAGGQGPRIGDVATLRTRLTPAAALPAEPCLFGVADLPCTGLVIATRTTATSRSRKRAVRAGDVLVSTLRPELCKAGLCPEDGFASTEIAALDVEPAWRGAVLGAARDPASWAAWQAAATGTSLPRFKPSDLAEHRLDLGPRELERRSEALAAACDGLLTDQRLAARLRATRDRVLPSLLAGELRVSAERARAATASLAVGYTRRPRRIR